ncbi:MAG: hypothetical protein WBN72_02975 [Nitrososphaeraceae archaeon]
MTKRRQRGVLIPVDQYNDDEGLGQIHHSSQRYDYVLYEQEQGKYKKYRKISKQYCNLCSKPVAFIAIFHCGGYKRKERFCAEHAKTDGPLPLLVLDIQN